MLIADAPSALRLHLKGRSLDLERSAPVALVEAVIDWYELERATDAVSTVTDGDMLLYQWGTYDWGNGPTFNYTITRQFIAAASDVDDQTMWQLSLTVHYSASDEFVSLGSGDKWCRSPDECDELRRHVGASPAAAPIRRETPLRIELEFWQV